VGHGQHVIAFEVGDLAFRRAGGVCSPSFGDAEEVELGEFVRDVQVYEDAAAVLLPVASDPALPADGLQSEPERGGVVQGEVGLHETGCNRGQGGVGPMAEGGEFGVLHVKMPGSAEVLDPRSPPVRGLAAPGEDWLVDGVGLEFQPQAGDFQGVIGGEVGIWNVVHERVPLFLRVLSRM